MTKHYQDYVWKGAIPYGLTLPETSSTTYKIIMDPYRKRISIEKYIALEFVQLIYDSYLLDFRTLKPIEQMAWQRSWIKETDDITLCHLRNQDDRILFFEECIYERNFCRECRISSPHGQLLSIHKMYYKAFNDSFDGVVLFDANQHSVMYKSYTINQNTGEFDKLIKEHWELNNVSF